MPLIDTNTKLLMHFNDNLTDTMGLNTPSIYGTEAYEDGKFSKALSCNYSCVKIPYTSNITFGSSDLTIACWVYQKKRNLGGGAPRIFSHQYRYSSTYPYAGLKLELNSTGNLKLDFPLSYDWTSTNTSTYVLPLNQWVHIALVRSGTAVTVYANGVSIISVSRSGSLYQPSSSTFKIGAGTIETTYADTPTNFFNGLIDEFIIVKGTALWTSNFTPPEYPYFQSLNVITATAGENGTISPSGSVEVGEGISQTFKFKSNSNFLINNVTIDSLSFGAIREYTFENVTQPHTISVDFSALNISDLIFDRTLQDLNTSLQILNKVKSGTALTEQEQALFDSGLRGCYNLTTDWNRVENKVSELKQALEQVGYNIPINKITTDWIYSDIASISEIGRYLNNISDLRISISVYATTPIVPTVEEWIDYQKANDIEKILFDLEDLIEKLTAFTFSLGDIYLGEV